MTSEVTEARSRRRPGRAPREDFYSAPTSVIIRCWTYQAGPIGVHHAEPAGLPHLPSTPAWPAPATAALPGGRAGNAGQPTPRSAPEPRTHPYRTLRTPACQAPLRHQSVSPVDAVGRTRQLTVTPRRRRTGHAAHPAW